MTAQEKLQFEQMNKAIMVLMHRQGLTEFTFDSVDADNVNNDMHCDTVAVEFMYSRKTTQLTIKLLARVNQH